jgi:DNA-binding MurR/RpiR family transcriptional regulator
MKPDSANVVAATTPLAERIEQLSAKRQEIVRPILEHPRGFVLLSVRAMAKRLHTDPATVVRIVRGLGFGSYREFQRHLHDLSIAFATPVDALITPAHGRESMPAHIKSSIDQDVKNLHGLKHSLDPQRLAAVAKRLHRARRTLILAGDLATVLAFYLEYQLSMLGLPVFAVTSAGRIGHAVRFIGKQDVAIAISFRRGLRQTVEGIREASERGCFCLAIADTYLSPLARICDEVFLASIECTSPGASYAAPIALANAMLAACGQHRRAHTLAIAREMGDEQRRGYRWFNA